MREYTRKIAIPPNSIFEREYFLVEDFEGKFDWTKDDFGGEGIVRKDPAAAHRGDYGAFLDVGNTNVDEWVSIDKTFEINPSPRYEFIVDWRSPLVNFRAALYFYVYLPKLNSANTYVFAISFNPINGEVAVKKSDGSWQLIGTIAAFATLAWYDIIMEINYNDLKYGKITIGNYVFDASAYAPETTALNVYRGTISILVYNITEGQRGSAYFDNIILRAIPL